MILKSYTDCTEKLIDLLDLKSTTQNKHGKIYYNQFLTFDIEVTNIDDNLDKFGIPYLYMFGFDENTIIYGRYLEEVKEIINYLNSVLECNLVIYVHNLSYEFQFIRKYFDWNEVFLTDMRKPIYCTYEKIEFRCSYLLSNMNLENFLKNNNCTILKLDYNYNVKRYPWTILTNEEMLYCAHDTAGLQQAIKNILKNDNDTLATIPYTSTGYVRRDVKQAQSYNTKKMIKKLVDISPDLYIMLKKCFVGGNTHANRFYVDKILENVHCYDITSSYPFAQCCNKFPIEPFTHKTNNLDDLEIDKNFAYCLEIQFIDIELKDFFDGMPQISFSKCIVEGDCILDNGRIVTAENIIICVTDIELSIIERHYKYKDKKILDCYYSRYDFLPQDITNTIYDYFYKKCTLKGKDNYLYMKSKNKLNSIYGMSAFDIGKQSYIYKNDEYIKENKDTSEILYTRCKGFSQAEPYSFGVWTTANARKNLDDLLCTLHDNFVYCDTDSIYTRTEIDLYEINDKIKQKSEKYKVEYNGKEFYLGIWTKDKFCKQFKTEGAKKYCYVDENGKCNTVVAGVHKSSGAKSIKDFYIGATFKNATNKVWYCDYEVNKIIDNYKITIPSSAYIESGDYTLGVTDDYISLVTYAAEINYRRQKENGKIF